MAATPTIIACDEIAAEATRLRALFTSCYSVTATDMDDLVNLSYSASLCGSTTGLDQDNIVTVHYGGTAASSSLIAAAAAVNAMVTFTVGESEICILRISREEVSNLRGDQQLIYDYYFLKDVGKGTYGTAGTVIDQSNLLLMRSSQTYSIPTENSPVVYTVRTTDVTEAPEVSLNSYANGGVGFVIGAGPDYYFEMQETVTGLLATPEYTGNYALYRWVGANGHYGADGVDTAVNGDFVVVETNDGNEPGSSTQDNKVREISTKKATQPGIPAAVIAINTGVQFEIDEIENITFKVPRNQNTATKGVEKLWYDYYLLKGAGKGTYGLLGTQLTSSNLFLIRSTEGYTVESGEINGPVIYEIRTDDISNDPQDVLNTYENVTGYVIQADEDAWFEISEITESYTDSLVEPTFTGNVVLYKFIGANGTYGADGPDSAVLGDFTLEVDNSLTGNYKSNINTVEVINGINIASDNISKAVNRDYWGDITVDEGDELLFRALRKVTNVDASIMLLEESYHYTKGAGTISADSVDADFIINDSKIVIGEQANALAATKIHGVTTQSLAAPEAGVNNSVDVYTIDAATYDTYFVVYDSLISGTDYDVYKFDGADGTYGFGGAQTAVFGDFTLLTPYAEDITNAFATSHLHNDGADGSNAFITAADVPTPTGEPSGLEAINEGGNDGFRIIGRNAANFGNIGQDSVDFGTSTGASTTVGPTGNRSVNFGVDNENPYHETLMIGAEIIGASTNGYSSANIIVSDNVGVNPTYLYNNLYNNAIIGTENTIGTAGANLNTSVIYNSIVAGWNCEMYAGKDSAMFGQGLIGGAASCTIVGQGNVDETLTDATQQTSTTTAANPRFIVGNGVWNSDSDTGTRSNAFVVMSDGTVTAPSQTPALITAAGDYALLTKEYADLNFITGSVFQDDEFMVVSNTDPTAFVTFDLSSVSGSFVRQITMADANVDLADIGTNTAAITVLESQAEIFTIKVSLSAAQVGNIGTTPITAITKASGTVINVISAIAKLTWGSVAFDTNNLNLGFASGAPDLFNWSSFLDETADALQTASSTALTANDIVENEDLKITGTDSVAVGDSTVDIYITYEKITL